MIFANFKSRIDTKKVKIQVDTHFGRRFQISKKKFSTYYVTGNSNRKCILPSSPKAENRLKRKSIVDLVPVQIFSTGADRAENH